MNWYKEAKKWDQFEDFRDEFKWYQERGIGSSISEEELKKIWESSPITMIEPSELDAIGNTYTPEMHGENESERIKNFIEYATTENRDDASENEWSQERQKDATNYLKKLIESFRSGNYPPVNIVFVPGFGSFIVAGRTRAAIAKTLNVPLKIKKITIKNEEETLHEDAQKLFYDK